MNCRRVVDDVGEAQQQQQQPANGLEMNGPLDRKRVQALY